VAFAVLQGVVTVVEVGSMHSGSHRVSTVVYPSVGAVDDMTSAMNTLVRHQREHVATARGDKADGAHEIGADRSEFLAASKAFASLETSAADVRALAGVRTLFDRYMRVTAQVVPLSAAGKSLAA